MSHSPVPTPRLRWLVPVLAVLFLASGFSALVYQVLWTRLLSLVLGVTVHAASTVLATYMGGLALGSLIGGRLGDRLRRPLLAFGVVEALIGLSALLSPVAIDALQRAYVAAFPAFSGSPLLLAAARMGIAALILLVPTMLMGATLPLVVRSSLMRPGGLGTRVSVLYATNTTGAIVGALAAGFWLIPGFGIRTSFLVAALVNVTVGLTAALLSSVVTMPEPATAEPRGGLAATGPGGRATGIPSHVRRIVLGIFALSGFVSLALEVVWFRILVLFLGPTAYAFTVMLAAVLAGIAAGSYLIAPFMRRAWNWVAVLAALEFGVAIAALLSFRLLARSHDVAAIVATWLGVNPRSYFLPIVTVSFLAMFPASLIMGMAFPVGLRVWVGGETEQQHVSSRIGLFYALNVFGAIAGSLAAGFLLLPQLGGRGSLWLLAALVVAGAALLALVLEPRRVGLGVLAAGLAGAAVAGWTTPDPFDVALRRFYPGERELWREEGVQTTVSVHERGRGTATHRVMYLDGRHQASDTPSTLAVHRRIGLLPMAIHPDPRHALVIGLGGGATPGAVALFPQTHVTIVELSRTVVHGAEWFRHANGDVLRRPNVTLHVDDGRNFLLRSPRQYDVITADIILPVHAGATNLYSAEYFRLVQRALDYNGVVLQWLGSSSDAEYKLIARTFLSVFRNATLWGDGTLLVGTRHPLVLEREAFERKLRDPVTREALASVGLTSFDRLLSLFVAGPDELQAFVGPGPVLTDDRPSIEYFLTLPREPLVDLALMPRGDVMRYVR